MWILTIRSTSGEPRQYTIHPGNNTIGRMSGNDIVILDPSASRYHAKVILETDQSSVMVHDLGSTNGTFINRERMDGPRKLTQGDIIRIGQHMMELSYIDEHALAQETVRPHNTQQLTRELLLESLDQHGVLLYEVAARLNTILDLETALQTVANMMKVAMGADRCEVILKDKFEHLAELGFARSIAQQAIQQRSAVIVQDASSDPNIGKSAMLLHIHAAMCVPVISGEEMLGLIYVFKNRPRSRPFGTSDLQLAIAIGNQAALTIQRMQLLERVRKEELVSSLLHRFLSPQEAEYVIKDYLETGLLPPLDEHTITTLAVDIMESTRLAERLGSRRFSRVLSNYYKELTTIIFDHGGMLNKYVGDGMQAIFGMPHQPSNPEERAVTAALDILKRLETINADLGEILRLGIGVNTGPAIAGYLGSTDYVEFTVIGYPVNIAWGLEAIARPNRIFIGHPTYQAVMGKFIINPLGTVEIRKEPVQAYEVLP